MHPAYSVILFTTASGAGYGLLILMSLAGALGLVAPERSLGLVGFGLALGLITVGLLSSTLHLGRPERAWRALSEWRTSWLSREGVVAIATYVPAVIAAAGWVLFERASGVFAAAGLATAALALVTVFCTGQIYASLGTIRQWHQPLTTPVYLSLSLATGALIFNLMLIVARQGGPGATWLTLLLVLVALVLKTLYWANIDSARKTWTIEAATGLGALGKVRLLDPPHTQPNFVMREMGYAIGRKHARRLRLIASMALFTAPLALTLVTLSDRPILSISAALHAAAFAVLGVLVERWLFFAEAEHVSMLYYGRDAA